MSVLTLTSRSGSDGKLQLEIPVGQPNTEFEITVRPKPTRILPPDYFSLIGSVQDDTLIIHPQPPLPPSVVIE